MVGAALGSVTRRVDASQAIVSKGSTTAWCEPVPTIGNSGPLPDRHGFTQREKDPESGLMHFRARAYDPRTGRFTQTDPLLASRAAEHYVYGFNNPVSTTDPMGLYGGLATGPGAKHFTDRDPRAPAVLPIPADPIIRIEGTLQAVGGAVGIAGSATAMAAPTGATQVAGAVGLWYSLDNILTGLKKAWTGKRQRTVTGELLHAAAKPTLGPTYGPIVADAVEGGIAGVTMSAPGMAQLPRAPSVLYIPGKSVPRQLPAGQAFALNAERTLGEILKGVDPDSMIHLSTGTRVELTGGLYAGSSWVRLRDVAHLTPQQYRVAVVGRAAAGYSPEAKLFVIKRPSGSEFVLTDVPNLAGVEEFVSPRIVVPDSFVGVPPGPPMPFKPTGIPSKPR